MFNTINKVLLLTIFLTLSSFVFGGYDAMSAAANYLYPKQSYIPKVIGAIDQAKQQIVVQAWFVTSMPIAEALVAAKKRGVKVKVFLDESEDTKPHAFSKYLEANQIPTKIEYRLTVDDNKIIVIVDNDNIITENFNRTKNSSSDQHFNQHKVEIAEEVTEALAAALKVNKNLTKLELNSSGIGYLGAKALAEALKVNKTLISLNISENDVGGKGAQELAEALKINKTLTKLDISGNLIDVKGIKAFSEVLQDNKILTVLGLDLDLSEEIPIMSNEGLKVLARALKGNTSLTSISFGFMGEEIRPDVVKALVETLEDNRALTRLGFNGCKIDVEGISIVTEWLKNNKTITNLSFFDANEIGVNTAKALAEVLKVNQTLTSLSFRDAQISGEEVSALAAGLKDNKTLTHLSIVSGKENSGEGIAETLAAVLRSNTTLTDLTLSMNLVDAKGAKVLAEALAHNHTLTSLDFKHNKISAEAINALIEALKGGQSSRAIDSVLDYNEISIEGKNALAEALKSNKKFTLVNKASAAPLQEIDGYIKRNQQVAMAKKTRGKS